MINFGFVQRLLIPEGKVKQLSDSSGRILWKMPYNSQTVLSYNNTIQYGNTSVWRYQLTATSVRDFAIFGPGVTSTTSYSYADIWDKSLTNVDPIYLNHIHHFGAATTVGEYALFAGGRSRMNGSLTNTVDVIDSSLSHFTAPNLLSAEGGCGAITIGNYALFGGKDAVISAYDTSLTQITGIDPLTIGRYYIATALTDRQALFAGGYNSGTYYPTVDCYNASLVHTTPPTHLSSSRAYLNGATVNGHALFAGGINGTALNTVNSYDSALTMTTLNALGQARCAMASTSVEGYALFGAGMSTSSVTTSTVFYNNIDAYNNSLTHSIPEALPGNAGPIVATSLDKYALFGCYLNRDISSNKALIDVYEVN